MPITIPRKREISGIDSRFADSGQIHLHTRSSHVNAIRREAIVVLPSSAAKSIVHGVQPQAAEAVCAGVWPEREPFSASLKRRNTLSEVFISKRAENQVPLSIERLINFSKPFRKCNPHFLPNALTKLSSPDSFFLRNENDP